MIERCFKQYVETREGIRWQLRQHRVCEAIMISYTAVFIASMAPLAAFVASAIIISSVYRVMGRR
ncbi:hypothetical protein D0Y50_01525 [Salinimonas sediminis]|uniref:Uncharacterized protein n=1 Tax=Salinimonas sediminis TaxID=2303538 RepID=A0A346NI08_9ALTE|nr:hypothetical protein D0Y50_01525 [Salinimonas sediminis]